MSSKQAKSKKKLALGSPVGAEASVSGNTGNGSRNEAQPSSEFAEGTMKVLANLHIQGADAEYIMEKLKELYSSIHKVENERESGGRTLDDVHEAQEKFQSNPSQAGRSKLKNLYKTAIQDADDEAEALRKCLEIIQEIRSTVRTAGPQRPTGLLNTKGPAQKSMRRGQLMKMLTTYAQTLPLFVPRHRKDKCPPLCGAIPAETSYIAKRGELVAALVKGAENDESNWILAEVVLYNSNAARYEIDDIDEEQKERHNLSRRRVIPLPTMRANPETNPEAIFEKDTPILALYPQTTCFYKGIVYEVPKTAQEDYQVLFEDAGYDSGYAPPLTQAQRYVIRYKEIRKKN